MVDVIIVGAGLSGLSAAYYLKQKGINYLVLEARERTGGRIETLIDSFNGTPVEMGATWFAEKHTFLMSLVKELDLNFFFQYQKGICVYETASAREPQLFTMPDNEAPSYRIAGGSAALINRLVDEIGKENVQLGLQVNHLSEKDDCIEVQDTKGNIYPARQVVVTIPPYLLTNKVAFTPSLPNNLVSVMNATHTWMSDAMKFAVVYANPFWRNKDLSGTVLSQVGVAAEVYDHTSIEETRFALKGFLANSAAALPKEQREEMVVAQLMRLLGAEAGTYLSYNEKLWAYDPYTHAAYRSYMTPHQNSGHLLYQQPYMNNRLYISGSETSPHFGGYMDGAVYSGLRSATSVLQFFGKQHNWN